MNRRAKPSERCAHWPERFSPDQSASPNENGDGPRANQRVAALALGKISSQTGRLFGPSFYALENADLGADTRSTAD